MNDAMRNSIDHIHSLFRQILIAESARRQPWGRGLWPDGRMRGLKDELDEEFERYRTASAAASHSLNARRRRDER